MIIQPITTRILLPPRDNLFEALVDVLSSVPEKSILAITSKSVSIAEGRCTLLSQYPDKDVLVAEEADRYLPRTFIPGAWCMHTIKNNIFIPSAGVDESNANGHYILWPRDPKRSARELHQCFQEKYKVKNLGIIITDSHTIPLRRGVLGISLAHYGFVPLRDYRGKADIFGRKLRMTQSNIADSLAAAAVLVMGEGGEQTPLALIKDVPNIVFTTRKPQSRRPFSSFEITTNEDMYWPLLKSVPWRKGGGGKRP